MLNHGYTWRHEIDEIIQKKSGKYKTAKDSQKMMNPANSQLFYALQQKDGFIRVRSCCLHLSDLKCFSWISSVIAQLSRLLIFDQMSNTFEGCIIFCLCLFHGWVFSKILSIQFQLFDSLRCWLDIL